MGKWKNVDGPLGRCLGPHRNTVHCQLWSEYTAWDGWLNVLVSMLPARSTNYTGHSRNRSNIWTVVLWSCSSCRSHTTLLRDGTSSTCGGPNEPDKLWGVQGWGLDMKGLGPPIKILSNWHLVSIYIYLEQTQLSLLAGNSYVIRSRLTRPVIGHSCRGWSSL